MSDKINYNHRHTPSGTFISGSGDGYLTVGDLRDAIFDLPDSAEVIFGIDSAGEPLKFGRFKMRGHNIIAIEFQ